MMSAAAQKFRELTETMRPQATAPGFDSRPGSTAALILTPWAVYVPLRVGGKIVVPEPPAHG